MLLHILGSCAGTEPVAGRDYTSWVLECDDCAKYWFDCGGAAARTAYLKGLDPTDIRALFLSHTHLDHIAGIPLLLQTIKKQQWLVHDPSYQALPIYTSRPQIIDAAREFFICERGNLAHASPEEFTLELHELDPGEIFRDHNIAVEALPNHHQPPDPETGKPVSYSFRIFCQGKTIVFTGDIANLYEIDTWLQQHVDVLLLETGHHKPWEQCEQIRQRPWNIDQLLFVHNGHCIFDDPVTAKKRADQAWGKPVIFSCDGMTFPLLP